MTLEGKKGEYILCSPQQYCAIISACAHELNSLVFAQHGILDEKYSKPNSKIFRTSHNKLNSSSTRINAISELVCTSRPNIAPTRLETILAFLDIPKTYSKSLVSVDPKQFNLALNSILNIINRKRFNLALRSRPKYLALKLSFSKKYAPSKKINQLLIQGIQNPTILAHDCLTLINIKLSIQILSLSSININYVCEDNNCVLVFHIPRSHQLALMQ